VTGAETTAAFLLERVRAARGPQWNEGRGRVPAPAPPSGPALQIFGERRVRGVPEAVGRRCAPFEPALDVLLGAMDLHDDVREAARAVSPRRDRPAEARRLLDHLEAEGRC